jgi:hypothetical protein
VLDVVPDLKLVVPDEQRVVAGVERDEQLLGREQRGRVHAGHDRGGERRSGRGGTAPLGVPETQVTGLKPPLWAAQSPPGSLSGG